VYAFERDQKRAQILNNRVSKAILGNEDRIECLNLDFIENRVPGIEEKQDEVLKFIVCDPSCSGSGMRLHT
jgi:16S rRNA C967 or C1407 C5-methylase (RsmB/RsmF family)